MATIATTEASKSSARALIDFINKGPSPFHVIDTCKKLLRTAGFSEVCEKKKWQIAKGGKYFVTKNQSCLIAFTVGEKYESGNGFSIIGAHTDSPCLKVKPISKQIKSGYLSVGVECYGGGLWDTWFDRDLTIAGRVFHNKEGAISDSLIHVKRPILKVPNLCIHLARSDRVVNKETHTAPILATELFENALNKESEGAKIKDETKVKEEHHSSFVRLICEEIGCKPEDLLDMELMLADTQPASTGGLHDEFIFAPRLDNLFNTYCAIAALTLSCENESLKDERYIRMINLYDNEEVGSQSAQGAGSMLTENVLRRVCECLESSFEQSIANSFLLSADQAHAIHPNYPGKHEENHKPSLHGGPVVKINSNQRYATTSESSSILRVIAKKCDVPLQKVCVRNDSPCGSTIGPILAAKLGMRTLDIGGPQLSMHSIRETCCTSSVQQSIDLYSNFFIELPKIDEALKLE